SASGFHSHIRTNHSNSVTAKFASHNAEWDFTALRRESLQSLCMPLEAPKLTRVFKTLLQSDCPMLEAIFTFIDFDGEPIQTCSCTFTGLKSQGVLKLFMVSFVPTQQSQANDSVSTTLTFALNPFDFGSGTAAEKMSNSL